MERLEKSFDIGAPVNAVYQQWMHFEDFPRFMQGIDEVRRLDETHLHWRASVAGHAKEWDAEITQHVPDEVIAWRSTSGAPNAGTVRFEPIGADATRVRITMEYEPQDALEKAGDALGFVSRQVDRSVRDFRRLLEVQRRPAPPDDGGIPLLGKVASPGAPGSGMNDMAGIDVWKRTHKS